MMNEMQINPKKPNRFSPQRKRQLVIYCGAGVDVDSNLPTFTGVSNTSPSSTALWNQHKVDEVCNIKYWNSLTPDSKKRQDIWRFYQELRIKIKGALPSAFHHFVANLAKHSGFEVKIVTTNVSDLFERAGVPAENIEHVHGSIHHIKCTSCNEQSLFTNPINVQCNHCGTKNTFKPDIVFYGEQCSERYNRGLKIFDNLRTKDDILIMAGSSGMTFHQALDKWKRAKRKNVVTIQINPDPDVKNTYKAKYNFDSCEEALKHNFIV